MPVDIKIAHACDIALWGVQGVSKQENGNAPILLLGLGVKGSHEINA